MKCPPSFGCAVWYKRVQKWEGIRGDDGEIKKRRLGVLVMSAEKAWWSWGGLMRRCEAGTEERFEKERAKTWAFEEEQTERRGEGGKEGKSRGVQPSRTCLVLFHQPSLWKLASSSASFPALTSSQCFAWKEAIREGERGRDRERGAVAHTELSEALWGNKQCNLLCFSTSFPRSCSLPPLPPLGFLVDKTLYIPSACICMCMLLRWDRSRPHSFWPAH